MPIVVGMLVRGLLWALGTFAGRLLINLGIGYVVYQGADTLVSKVQSAIEGNLSGMSAELSQLCTVVNIPQAISIILGAITVRFSLSASKRFAINPA